MDGLTTCYGKRNPLWFCTRTFDCISHRMSTTGNETSFAGLLRQVASTARVDVEIFAGNSPASYEVSFPYKTWERDAVLQWAKKPMRLSRSMFFQLISAWEIWFGTPGNCLPYHKSASWEDSFVYAFLSTRIFLGPLNIYRLCLPEKPFIFITVKYIIFTIG